jgi:hypothetical protein
MPGTAPKIGNDRAPALRISNVVYGRRSKGNRVEYLVDPRGQGDERGIPETVVLRRWRKRRMLDHVFGGTRLSPTIWKAISVAFSESIGELSKLSPDFLQKRIETARSKLSQSYLTLPNAEQLKLLFDALGPTNLKMIMERHLAPERGDRFGTPDLFLYACKHSTNAYSFSRFVEVKRPSERISPDQKEEIAFLRNLGLRARVFRLIERSTPAHNAPPG